MCGVIPAGSAGLGAADGEGGTGRQGEEDADLGEGGVLICGAPCSACAGATSTRSSVSASLFSSGSWSSLRVGL